MSGGNPNRPYRPRPRMVGASARALEGHRVELRKYVEANLEVLTSPQFKEDFAAMMERHGYRSLAEEIRAGVTQSLEELSDADVVACDKCHGSGKLQVVTVESEAEYHEKFGPPGPLA